MNDKKTALIIGITGQDGSLCADLLLSNNYKVVGIIRRSSNFNTKRIEHIFDRVILCYGDLTDQMSIYDVISQYRPDEIYNFGAMSHVGVSSHIENYTFTTNTLGMLNILQSVRKLGLGNSTKVYHASTSEQFGNATDGTTLLNEESKMNPVSIYGISKLAAQNICNMYRDAFGMFVVSSILFNHEGPRRGHTFVTQKIARYVANLRCEEGDPLLLGNLNARRDWGSAKEYVYAIWLMMQKDTPDNYVIATGTTFSVREFTTLAFKEIDIDLEWIGSGVDEVGVCSKSKRTYVKVSPKYFREIDIECLIGDASKARRELNWEPKMSFKELIQDMVKCASGSTV